MRRITEEASRQTARSIFLARARWITAGCAAALLLLLIPLLHTGAGPAPAALFAQSADAMSHVRTLHITGRIRTAPNDNFEGIDVNSGFVPIEIWREYSQPPRWRVQKPGRVVVMDGQTAAMYMAGSNSVITGPPEAGFVVWLRPLLDPQSILQNEAADKTVFSTESSEANGVITVVVRRKAQGNFANDWARNTTIQTSDHNCTYRFDSATKRLEGLQVSIAVAGSDVTVAEFTVSYDEALSAALFTLELPAGVSHVVRPEEMKSAAVTLTGPKDAAQYFFDSLAHERWDDVLAVYPENTLRDSFKKAVAGLQVISIGEPFQSGVFPGYYVPYQIRFRNGYTKSFNLAVRNDNPSHRWIVDGGF